MQRIFQQSYHIPGTLTANITPRFTAPVNCTLLHASVVASNDSDATLKIGNSADDDAYLAATVVGDSGVPMVYSRQDFVGEQYPRITAGEVVVITLDFDGSSGTAAQNVTLVLTFAEG